MTTEDTPAPIKLKSKDIKPTRSRLLAEQNYTCALCKQACAEDQAVLDHDHAGGHVRAVLHRTCNAVEGKVIGAMRRFGIKNPDEFLSELVKYHDTHKQNVTGLIHPAHRTPDEKKELAKKRVQRKNKAKKAAKIPK